MSRLTVCATQAGRHAPLHFQCVPARSPRIMNPGGLEVWPKQLLGFAGDGCAISFTARHGHRASSSNPHYPSGAISKPAPHVMPASFAAGTGATWLHEVKGWGTLFWLLYQYTRRMKKACNLLHPRPQHHAACCFLLSFPKESLIRALALGKVVPRKGLEPPRSYSLVPETSASTNSATWASQERKRLYQE